jgi:hypothetical protein
MVSSLAFARGLWRWFPVAVRSDLLSPQRRQCALAVVSGTIYWEWLQMRGVNNPKGFGFYLYVNNGSSNDRMDKYPDG